MCLTPVLRPVYCGTRWVTISVVCEVKDVKRPPVRPTQSMQPQYGGAQWGYPPQTQPGLYPNTGPSAIGQPGYPGSFPQHQNPGYAHAPVMPVQQPPVAGYPHVAQPVAPTNVDAWIAQNAQGYNPAPVPQQSYSQPPPSGDTNTQPKLADATVAIPQQAPAVVVNARFEVVGSRR